MLHLKRNDSNNGNSVSNSPRKFVQVEEFIGHPNFTNSSHSRSASREKSKNAKSRQSAHSQNPIYNDSGSIEAAGQEITMPSKKKKNYKVVFKNEFHTLDNRFIESREHLNRKQKHKIESSANQSVRLPMLMNQS